jgi:predicted  nucleic acid-binding Zn-ribbon protein
MTKNEESIREQIRQIRALIQSAKERIAALRPVWGAYLARETLNSLEEAVGELERSLDSAAPAPPTQTKASRPSAG